MTPNKKAPAAGPAGSPFGLFDLGGGQREELRTQLTRLEARVESMTEDQRLKDLQIEVLRKLQKQETRTGRVARWQVATVGPVFSAWSRVTAAARAAQTLTQGAADAKKAAAEKDTQVKALIDRLATVKVNATAKLSGLSEANRKLAAALEEKDKALVQAEALAKHMRRTAGKQGEREVELQLALDECRESLRRSEAERARAQSEALSARRDAEAQVAVDADAAARGRALVATLEESLREADARLLRRDSRIAELEAHCERQALRVEGLQAEAACLKAEAVAERTLLRMGDGGDEEAAAAADAVWGTPTHRVAPLASPGVTPLAARSPRSALRQRHSPEEHSEDRRVLAATPGAYSACESEGALRALPSAAEVEVGKWRYALLSVVFWGWRDRVGFRRELMSERERNTLTVHLSSGHGRSTCAASAAGGGRVEPAAGGVEPANDALDDDGFVDSSSLRVVSEAVAEAEAQVTAARGLDGSTSGDDAAPSPRTAAARRQTEPGEAAGAEVVVGAVLKHVMEAKYAQLEAVWAPQLQRAQLEVDTLQAALAEEEERAAVGRTHSQLLHAELLEEEEAREARKQELQTLTAELRAGEAHALQLLSGQRHALSALGAFVGVGLEALPQG